MTVTEDACPELYKALQAVPSRLRAERVRTLSAIGLTAVSGSEIQSKVIASGSKHPVQDKAAPSGSARAVSFARSLADGV